MQSSFETTTSGLPESAGEPSLSRLETAVLQTVTYVDIFDYPLTAAEVHRYLVGVPASAPEVQGVLNNGRLVPQRLYRNNGFFALPGRAAIVDTRQRRAGVARQMWPRAVYYGRLMAALPFVHMVAVTGSLAVDNVEPNADIDYLVVTAAGRLWLCRAMVILVVRIAARRGVDLCPNYFLSERALVFQERNLYTARELVQMVPIAGLATYQKMRQVNGWVADFLPNALDRPRTLAAELPAAPDRAALWRTLAELALRTPPGGWLERWEMARKIRKFTRRHGGDETAFSADWCKGHFHSHGRRTLEEFASHWQAVTRSDVEGRR
ncbi:MAG: hypothetical protein L0332_08810 [Chloroflexi bacterium]|nr:hypothetical protein [Chloroflexota bacterium]MCI0576671.1 hypothetical protein [Chloroflexota bacterium]MCI0647984.1 hypothetical protein [Chloroflexota bacterium]MCI0726806.1 hypothetical protein [Chloroflexota bacterium]